MADETQKKYAQAMALLSGRKSEPSLTDVNEASRVLESLVERSPAIPAQLAVLHMLQCHAASSDEMARDLYLRAAMGGFPPAVRGLAVILLGQSDGENLGASLLRRAAKTGDWIAAFLLLREAARGQAYAPLDELSQLAMRLSPAVPLYEDLSAALLGLPDCYSLQGAPFEKILCETALRDAFAQGVTFDRKRLSETPRIETLPDLLTPLECDYLIAVSSAFMQPSKVVDADVASAVGAQYRTSDGGVLLPSNMDVVTALIQRKLSLAAGIAPENGEFLSLLRYRPGQEYRPHHDFLATDAQDYSKIKACGQRGVTLLTYLNTGYGGGETAFPKLELSVKGVCGDGLYFQNIDKNGAPLQTSLHAGRPVTSSEKWLATLWCRERAFWPWMRD